MKILINDQQKLLNVGAADKANSKIVAAMARFGPHIKKIELSVRDTNGPNDGNDQECQVLVTLKQMKEVAVIVHCDSLSKAIASCVKRAERSVSRSVDRRSLGDRRRSSLGFAFYN